MRPGGGEVWADTDGQPPRRLLTLAGTLGATDETGSGGPGGTPGPASPPRLTRWEGRARRARGAAGRRWGHTTSYWSTWGSGVLGAATVGEKGVSRPGLGLHLLLQGSHR